MISHGIVRRRDESSRTSDSWGFLQERQGKANQCLGIDRLTWGDVATECGVATLRDTKNGEMRALPIKGAALTAIKAMPPAEDAAAATTLHVFAGPPGPIFDYAKPFNAARDAAGIKNFRFHDCRHSTASYLAMNGGSASEIAAVPGHRTLAMVSGHSGAN